MAKTDPLILEKQKELYMAMFSSFSKTNLISFTPPKNSAVQTYTKEDLRNYLSDMSLLSNQKNLRNISRYLYYASSHYRSIINYYSTLYNFDYVVEAYGMAPETKDIDKVKKSYIKHVNSYEQMNIKYESLKIRANAYVDGVFFGYAIKTKNGFYVQHLDPDYCTISFINLETGLYGYSFDFSIFRRNEALLDDYPEEFRSTYLILKASKPKSWFARIESINAICVKPAVGIDPVPPLVGIFEGLLDIYDFKALAKSKEEMGNYQLLAHRIPMRLDKDADPDHLMLSADFVQSFHDNVAANLPETIGLLTTPLELEPIKFDKEASESKAVAEATRQLWNEAGVSELLFGNSTSSTGLKMSITADESALTTVVDIIEKWVNEYAKENFKGVHNFKYRIIRTTKFNQNEYLDSRIKAASVGIPVKNEIVAIMGMSPSAAYLNAYLENEVLELNTKFIPLQTSYTLTGDEEGGRTPSPDGTRSESGDKNIENDANEND